MATDKGDQSAYILGRRKREAMSKSGNSPVIHMDPRRKKLLYQSQHCGMKENDFLLGRYAVRFIETMVEDDLRAFEALLEDSDNDIYNWITGREDRPERHRNAFVDALIAFNK